MMMMWWRWCWQNVDMASAAQQRAAWEDASDRARAEDERVFDWKKIEGV